MRLVFLDVFQSDPATGAQTIARLFDPAQETRIVFEAVWSKAARRG
jgi:hypothetical protein